MAYKYRGRKGLTEQERQEDEEWERLTKGQQGGDGTSKDRVAEQRRLRKLAYDREYRRKTWRLRERTEKDRAREREWARKDRLKDPEKWRKRGRDAYAKRLASMNEAERQEFRRRKAERAKERRRNETPEQRERRLQRMREYKKRRKAAETPEEREVRKTKEREASRQYREKEKARREMQ